MSGFGSLALLGAGLAVAGTVAQISAQRRTARAQEQQQTLSVRQQRRQAIRSAQLARAAALVSASGSGTLQSSGVAGGIGSISSKLGADFGFGSQMSGLSRNISSAQRLGSFGQGLSSLGGSIFNLGINTGANVSDVLDIFRTNAGVSGGGFSGGSIPMSGGGRSGGNS